jgi:hypothetical protein
VAEKWSEERVLAEARRRTKALNAAGDNDPQKMQAMLEALYVESGWEEEDFIWALNEDVVAGKGKLE